MIQEREKLLFKDLCTRLPYGVNLHIEFYDLQGDEELASRDVKLTTGNICYCFDNSHWVNFKPYLRSMSSMTEDERKEYDKLIANCLYDAEAYFFENYNRLYDWLNEHHFDFRSLIEKGLALEAPEGMYKTK